MPTIDYKDLIDEMIKNNGHYMDDPQVVKIVEYTNAYGKQTWGVIYPTNHPDTYKSNPPYVNNPKVIWERKRASSSIG